MIINNTFECLFCDKPILSILILIGHSGREAKCLTQFYESSETLR